MLALSPGPPSAFQGKEKIGESGDEATVVRVTLYTVCMCPQCVHVSETEGSLCMVCTVNKQQLQIDGCVDPSSISPPERNFTNLVRFVSLAIAMAALFV